MMLLETVSTACILAGELNVRETILSICCVLCQVCFLIVGECLSVLVQLVRLLIVMIVGR